MGKATVKKGKRESLAQVFRFGNPSILKEVNRVLLPSRLFGCYVAAQLPVKFQYAAFLK
jgi:hypothetical protein